MLKLCSDERLMLFLSSNIDDFDWRTNFPSLKHIFKIYFSNFVGEKNQTIL